VRVKCNVRLPCFCCIKTSCSLGSFAFEKGVDFSVSFQTLESPENRQWRSWKVVEF